MRTFFGAAIWIAIILAFRTYSLGRWIVGTMNPFSAYAAAWILLLVLMLLSLRPGRRDAQ